MYMTTLNLLQVLALPWGLWRMGEVSGAQKRAGDGDRERIRPHWEVVSYSYNSCSMPLAMHSCLSRSFCRDRKGWDT